MKTKAPKTLNKPEKSLTIPWFSTDMAEREEQKSILRKLFPEYPKGDVLNKLLDMATKCLDYENKWIGYTIIQKDVNKPIQLSVEEALNYKLVSMDEALELLGKQYSEVNRYVSIGRLRAVSITGLRGSMIIMDELWDKTLASVKSFRERKRQRQKIG